MNKNTITGIDIAKNTFYLIKINQSGTQTERKKLNREQLTKYIAIHKVSTIAMEACATSHYWGRKFTEMGHKVELLAAQHVKGYLRGQKNDYNDARAIAEACQHGAIRAVPVKTLEQQDSQTFLRMRKHISDERTRLSNHIRGLLAEYGVVVPQGAAKLRQELPLILEDGEIDLTVEFRSLLNRQFYRLLDLDEELAWYTEQLEIKTKEQEECKRLMKIPGFGPVVSFAFLSWIGNGQQFKRGRDASAALGLVPRQFSTGGKERLLGITKRGDKQLRSLMVHGARAVASRAKNNKDKKDKLSLWIKHLIEKRGFNKAVVALANKMARIAWVIVAREEQYKTS